MDWHADIDDRPKRWVTHAGHTVAAATRGPHCQRSHGSAGRFLRHFLMDRESEPRHVSTEPHRLVTLDGSRGEGGGQILRTALTLSLLTGRPFRLVKVRANRDKPGLRPQHLSAVEAAAELGSAEVRGASVGSRDLTFRPGPYEPRDLTIKIGTAGSTALVLQTLHLPIALRASGSVRVTISGGTFNIKAPSFPFLETTWRAHLERLGAPIALTMPLAGFYPKGGGELDAWIEPATLRPLTLTERGPLGRVRALFGVSRLPADIAERMRARTEQRLADAGFSAKVEFVAWDGPSPGVAMALVAEHEGTPPATFVGLGERGKRAEAVADEAVDELLAFEATTGAIDPHSADQIMLPLALAAGRSEYTVSEVTDHLRTNAETIAAFLDRTITIEEDDGSTAGRVVVA